jgi:hypothetical protein
MAIAPKILLPIATAKAVATSDPKIVIPERAFIPDINGV